MNLNESKSLQFELWQECNNNCKFCYLGHENRRTPKDVKLSSLQRALNIISDENNYPEYNTIGFIGGEFFQGQLKDADVRSLFFKVMKKTADLYNSKKIKQVWISATLTIGHQQDLYQTLRLFNDHNDIWIITSWDTIGRFKSDKMKNTWDFHMKNLRKEFPQIKINICTILTDDCITKYLDGKLSFQAMMHEYNASFFFKQCGCIYNKSSESSFADQMKAKQLSNIILPGFFPTRKKFINFLKLFKEQETEDMWMRLFNIKYRADNLFRSFNDGSIDTYHRFKDTKGEVDDSDPMPCGHPFVYCAYIDSDACVLCDKQKLSLYD